MGLKHDLQVRAIMINTKRNIFKIGTPSPIVLNAFQVNPIPATTKRLIPHVLTALLLSSVGIAGEAWYFKLKGPGTAGLYLSESGTAVFHDGGNPGRQGIADVHLDGNHLFEFINSDSRIRELVFCCSHPDRDHIGGMKELVRLPGLVRASAQVNKQRFSKLWFIDSNVPKEQRLVEFFKQAIEPYTREVPEPVLPQIAHIDATANNAFKQIFHDSTDMSVENWVYEPAEGGGVHDYAVIPLVTLQVPGKGSLTLADLDDASQALTVKFANEMIKTGRTIDVIVLPHHGSSSNSVIPILRVPGLKSAILSVNADNQYLHPSLDNLLQCARALGPTEVFVTAIGNVNIGHRGVSQPDRTPTSLLDFVIGQRERIERNLTGKPLSERSKRKLYCEREIALELESMLRAVPRAVYALALKGPGGPNLQRDIDTAGESKMQESKPIEAANIGLAPTEAENKKRWRREEASAARVRPDKSSGNSRFKRNLEPQRMPDLGGIQLGAIPTSDALRAQRSEFVGSGNDWHLVVQTNDGRIEIRDFTASELRIAYDLVAADDVALVTASSRGSGHVTAVNPMLWNTLFAYDGARLDVMLDSGESINVGEGAPMDLGMWSAILWYDEEAQIRLVNGQVVISPKGGNPSTLIRLRVVVVSRPDCIYSLDPVETEDPICGRWRAVVISDPVLRGMRWGLAGMSKGTRSYTLQSSLIDERGRELQAKFISTLPVESSFVGSNAKDERVGSLVSAYPSGLTIDRLARARAMMYWLRLEGCLPTEAPSMQARPISPYY
jgi:hypothetical protein